MAAQQALGISSFPPLALGWNPYHHAQPFRGVMGHHSGPDVHIANTLPLNYLPSPLTILLRAGESQKQNILKITKT